LFFEEELKTSDEVVLEELAFGDEGVDLFLFDFPADSVDEKGNFDGVVLRNQWVAFWLL